MTEQTQVPPDEDPRGQDTPVTGDVTRDGGPDQPTVTPQSDDPDREGEDRFDAG